MTIRLTAFTTEAPSDPENPQPLPVEWKACSPSNPNYAFRYAHTQSALEYLVKVSRLGSKAVINGLGIGDEKVHTLDIVTKDFVSISSLPYTIPPSAGINETALALRQIFISAGRLTDLGTFFKLQVIQKLAPSLRKAGHEDSAHAASHSPSNPQQREEQERQDNPARRPEDPPTHDPLRDPTLPAPARPYPLHDPLAAGPPRRPHPAGDFPPPGFEDEYEINRPPRGGIGGPERRPLNIGERDLYPQGLGPNDPFRGGGGVGPGLGGMGGGGMHPTFDDPIFGDRGGFGGAGYDPQYAHRPSFLTHNIFPPTLPNHQHSLAQKDKTFLIQTLPPFWTPLH